MNIVYDCLRNLILRSSHQTIVKESGVIPMLLSQETSEELVKCVLSFTINSLLSPNEREEDGEGEGEDENGFLDHLVASGLIRFFVSALKSKRLLQDSTTESVIASLQMIRKTDPRYLKMFQDLKLPRLLEPVIMGDVEMEGVYLKLLLSS
jgi:hypothetical protein